MNLKDLDPEVFLSRLQAYADDARASFSREVESRVNEARRGVEDIMAWKTKGGSPTAMMGELFAQFFGQEATVFTTTLYKPSAHRMGPTERDVRLDFDGWPVTLGRTMNAESFYGARVVLIIVPEKKP